MYQLLAKLDSKAGSFAAALHNSPNKARMSMKTKGGHESTVEVAGIFLKTKHLVDIADK